MFKGAAAILGAAIAAIGTVPLLGSILSPLLGGRNKKEDSGFLAAIPLGDLVTGVPLRVELTSTVVDGWTRTDGVVGAAWLLKKEDGSVTALSTVCPHSGCSINLATKETYACPCHDSAFALDGTPMKGPSPRPMDPLTVQVREKQVYLRYARFKQGTKGREEI